MSHVGELVHVMQLEQDSGDFLGNYVAGLVEDACEGSAYEAQADALQQTCERGGVMFGTLARILAK